MFAHEQVPIEKIIADLRNDDPVIHIEKIQMDSVLLELILEKIDRVLIKQLILHFEFINNASNTQGSQHKQASGYLSEILAKASRIKDLDVLIIKKSNQLVISMDLATLYCLETIISSSPNLKTIDLIDWYFPLSWELKIINLLSTYKNLQNIGFDYLDDGKWPRTLMEFFKRTLEKENSMLIWPKLTGIRKAEGFVSGELSLQVWGNREYRCHFDLNVVNFDNLTELPPLENSLFYERIWLNADALLQYSTREVMFRYLEKNIWQTKKILDGKAVHFLINHDTDNIIIGADDNYFNYKYKAQMQQLELTTKIMVPHPADFPLDQFVMIPLLNGGASLLNIEFTPRYSGLNTRGLNDDWYGYSKPADAKKNFILKFNDLNVPFALDAKRIIINHLGKACVYNIDNNNYEDILANWHLIPLWGKNMICGFNINYPEYNTNLGANLDLVPESITVTFWQNSVDKLEILRSMKIAFNCPRFAPVLFNSQKNILFVYDDKIEQINVSNLTNKPSVFTPSFQYKILDVRQPTWKETLDFKFNLQIGSNNYKLANEKNTIDLPMMPYLLPQTFEHAIFRTREEILDKLLTAHTKPELCQIIAPEIVYYINEKHRVNHDIPDVLKHGLGMDQQQLLNFAKSEMTVEGYIKEVVAKDDYVFGAEKVMLNAATSSVDLVVHLYKDSINIKFDPSLNIPEKSINLPYSHGSRQFSLGYKEGKYFSINRLEDNFVKTCYSVMKRKLWCHRYTIATETDLFEITCVMRHIKDYINKNQSCTKESVIEVYNKFLPKITAETPSLGEIIALCMEWYVIMVRYNKDGNRSLEGNPLLKILHAYHELFNTIYLLRDRISGVDNDLVIQFSAEFLIKTKAIEDQNLMILMTQNMEKESRNSSAYSSGFIQDTEADDISDLEDKEEMIKNIATIVMRGNEWLTEPDKRAGPLCIIS